MIVRAIIEDHAEQGLRHALSILFLGEGGGIVKRFPDFTAIQKSLFIQTVKGGHHGGVSQAGSKFNMQITDAGFDFTAVPDAFHQLGFKAAQLLQGQFAGSVLSFQPHGAICVQNKITVTLYQNARRSGIATVAPITSGSCSGHRVKPTSTKTGSKKLKGVHSLSLLRESIIVKVFASIAGLILAWSILTCAHTPEGSAVQGDHPSFRALLVAMAYAGE